MFKMIMLKSLMQRVTNQYQSAQDGGGMMSSEQSTPLMMKVEFDTITPPHMIVARQCCTGVK